MAEQCRVNAELEALQTSVSSVRDLVLGHASGSSSLAASLAMVVKEVENRVNTTVANGFRWGARSALVVILSHFPELKSKLELIGSGQDANLSDNQVNALCPLVSVASDSLASLVPSSLAHEPPNDAEY
jgi:hypothetical protein